jgi:hypothetical protein
MMHEFTTCPECCREAERTEREQPAGERIDHYQCPHCGCYYTVSFQVRDPELKIWEEV